MDTCRRLGRGPTEITDGRVGTHWRASPYFHPPFMDVGVWPTRRYIVKAAGLPG